MKKVIILFLLIATNAFSQISNIKAFIGCYGDKDTISTTYLNSQSGICLLSTLSNEDYIVSSYDMILFSKGSMNTLHFNHSSFMARSIYNPCKAIREGDKILLQNIKAQLKNPVSGKIVELKIAPATFFIGKNCSKNCTGLNRFSSSHKDIAKVELACFGDGDVASLKDVLKKPVLSFIDIDPNYTVELVSYIVYTQMGDKPFCPSCKDGNLGPSFLGGQSTDKTLTDIAIYNIKRCDSILPLEFMHLNDILVNVTDKRSKLKKQQMLNPITIKIAKESIKQCGSNSSKVAAKSSVNYAGKLLTGKDGDQPVIEQKVVLQDQNDKDIQVTTTDKYGDFKFTELSTDKTYKINVMVTDDTKIKDGLLYAARPDGTIIRSFNKTSKGFVYELLPMELATLASENEEDTELKIKNFGASKDAALIVIENIYYDLNSAEIKQESLAKLDKIISAMAQNRNLKLSINSHTDANGEDAYNMTLSEKRAQKVMEYFISQGIDKNRLTSKGLGETQIKNRCKNGVDCSETEHQLNRRTEFNFTK